MPLTHKNTGADIKRKTKKPRVQKELFKVLSTLENADEMRRFIHDLCTPKEIADMADRWLVARLLYEGELSYREIHCKTGVSVTTVGRVARFLEQENFKGYQLVLKRSEP